MGGGGTVFELTRKPDGVWTREVLHSFPAFKEDGFLLTGTIAFDAAGNLYGTAAGGGYTRDGRDGGVLFELSPRGDGTWTETLLIEFNSLDKIVCGPKINEFENILSMFLWYQLRQCLAFFGSLSTSLFGCFAPGGAC